MEENVKMFIKEAGGRLLDCAQNYLNEAEIGDAIHACIFVCAFVEGGVCA